MPLLVGILGGKKGRMSSGWNDLLNQILIFQGWLREGNRNFWT
jgi:hypothetical protein